MEKEFNLSDKRKELRKEIVKVFAEYKFSHKHTTEGATDIILNLIKEQDEEAVRRLKEEMGANNKINDTQGNINDGIINKIFGEPKKNDTQ